MIHPVLSVGPLMAQDSEEALCGKQTRPSTVVQKNPPNSNLPHRAAKPCVLRMGFSGSSGKGGSRVVQAHRAMIHRSGLWVQNSHTTLIL